MRFPLRLTADLTLGLAVRSLRLNRDRPLIVNLEANSNAGGAHHVGSPIVWIGGPEPLDLPETPRFVNSLASAGRHVFLPTAGILLRRRIHEFQPSPRLHLTVRFDGAEAAHDARAGREGAFRDALESVRTARLSGFLLCAQLTLHAPGDAAELTRLHGELRKLDFDGFLISSAVPTQVPISEDLRRTVARLRQQLLTRRWALLSRMLDSVLSPAPATITSSRIAPQRARHQVGAQMPPPQSCEESVQAP
jgi:hypothetical protein